MSKHIYFSSSADFSKYMKDYIQLYLDVMGDDISPLQAKGLEHLMTLMLGYYKEVPGIVVLDNLFRKKLLLLFQVNNSADYKEWSEVVIMRYNGNTYVPKYPRFHLLEEEAVQWCMLSLQAPPSSMIAERYAWVAEQLFPKEYKKMMERDRAPGELSA